MFKVHLSVIVLINHLFFNSLITSTEPSILKKQTFYSLRFEEKSSLKNIDKDIHAQFRKKLNAKDSITYNRLKVLIARYVNPKPDSALYYIKKIKQFSLERNYGIGLADADYLMGSYYRRMQQNDSALVYFNKSLELAKKIGYKKGISVCNNGICHIKYLMGKNKEAIYACLKCAEIARSLNDYPTLADTYIAVGNTYAREHKLDQSLKYYLKVDSLHSVHPLRPIIIAAAYQSIGDVYKSLKEYDKSEEYFLKANTEFKKLKQGAEFFLNTTNWHLGEVYLQKKQYKKADSLLQQSYVFFNTIKDYLTLAHISIDLGQINMKNNNPEEAEKYFLQSYKLVKDMGNTYEVSVSAIELGNLYLKQKQYDKAITYYQTAVQIQKNENNSQVIQESYANLSKAYAGKKDFKNAYLYLYKASQLKDSINQTQNAAKIRELEAIYQTEKKEKEIALLSSKNKIIEQQKRMQRNLFLGIMSFVSLLALFLFSLYKNRQKVVRKLKELDQAKSDFFANISHEFRTPLTLILSPVKQRLKQNRLTKEDSNLLQIIQQNAERLLDLVNQVLDLTKLQAGKRKLNVSQVDPQNFLGLIAHNFESLAQQKNISYTIDNQCKEEFIWIDKDVIQKITNNLLSNSFKYTEKGGQIRFFSDCKDGKLIIKIQDTGKKLTQEDLNRIYERFYQKNKHSEGIGLGLSIVKQLVQLHKGRIKAESGEDGWTVFQVVIPIEKSVYKLDEITKQSEPEKNYSPQYIAPENTHQPEHCPIERTDDPILLIIEDNSDVRKYIANIFKDCFKVITAKDGEDGMEKAFANIPDIIISDVMMPGKDGVEVLTALKSCERTNHIPVILLTAKAGEENKIKGLFAGADDYIEKPFNEEILKLKVNNLINYRKKIKEKILDEYLLIGKIPKDIPDKDQRFFEHLTQVLDKKITNPDFSADDFAKAMGMSRMQLHRKLTALTGQSTSQFIKIQRLNQAAVLLKNSNINISEIAYQVGFNSPGYFNQCFKKQFGCTPKEFKSQLN